MKSNHKTLAILGLMIFLGGCDQTRDVFGLSRNSAEEFAVNDRPPLVTPVHYQLATPKSSDQANLSRTSVSSTHAKAALHGSSSVTPTQAGASGVEKTLLSKTGAHKADPNIRAQVNKDHVEEADGLPALGEKLVFWKDKKRGNVIDPVKENAKFNG